MRQTFVALLVALALAATAAGQVSGPPELTVQAGRLAALPLDVTGGQFEYRILGDSLDGFREYDPDPTKLRLRVIGYTPGTAWVIVASMNTGKLAPVYVCKVTVVGGVPPIPPVPPDPKPPPPVPPDPPVPAGPVKFVIVVEETADAKANRGAFFADAALLAKLKAGDMAWRSVDQNVVGVDGKPPKDVAKILDDAKGKPLPRVYLLNASGHKLFAGNLSDTPDRLIGLIETYSK